MFASLFISCTWLLQIHAHLFPSLYRGHWRAVLEAGWLGFLIDGAMGQSLHMMDDLDTWLLFFFSRLVGLGISIYSRSPPWV